MAHNANSRKLASLGRRDGRTLAQRRADLEQQIRAALDPHMAVTDLTQVSARLKTLRKRTGLKQYEVASRIDEPPRTFQSWENGEVETDKENYEKIAKFYGVTANWILFGQDEEPPLPSGTPEMNGGGQDTLAAQVAHAVEARIVPLVAAIETQLRELQDQLSDGPTYDQQVRDRIAENAARADKRRGSKRPKSVARPKEGRGS